jgi:hypothetical protein
MHKSGYHMAVNEIAAWHTSQSAIFADMAKNLERDRASATDIERAKWASASHAAHASYIARNFRWEARDA